MAANEERNTPEDAETAIDQPPSEWNFTDGAGDQSEGNHTGARDETEGDDPFVTHGVDPRTDEGRGNYKMSECEPVGTVCKKWIVRACKSKRAVDAFDPWQQSRELRDWLHQAQTEHC